MAYDKVVDSTQLYMAFTAIANAIRLARGTTAKIPYQDLADKISEIPDETIAAFFAGEQIIFSNSKARYIREYAFYGDTYITTVSCPIVIRVNEYAFSGGN